MEPYAIWSRRKKRPDHAEPTSKNARSATASAPRRAVACRDTCCDRSEGRSSNCRAVATPDRLQWGPCRSGHANVERVACAGGIFDVGGRSCLPEAPGGARSTRRRCSRLARCRALGSKARPSYPRAAASCRSVAASVPLARSQRSQGKTPAAERVGRGQPHRSGGGALRVPLVRMDSTSPFGSSRTCSSLTRPTLA